jgi:hypothetical protein
MVADLAGCPELTPTALGGFTPADGGLDTTGPDGSARFDCPFAGVVCNASGFRLAVPGSAGPVIFFALPAVALPAVVLSPAVMASLEGGPVLGPTIPDPAGFLLAVGTVPTSPAGLATIFGAAGLTDPSIASAADFVSLAGLSGTEGSRCARMSAARTRMLSYAVACRSCFSTSTITSSSLLRLAAGLILMFKNNSLPFPTFMTVPTGRPLGKIWSPPLVSTFSPT